jgi:hypothetical protein
MGARADLFPAEPKIEAFLTDLAVRADEKVTVPVVLTREEVAAMLSFMDGTAQLVAKLLIWERIAHYGSRPAAGSGYRLPNETTDGPRGQGRQGSLHFVVSFCPLGRLDNDDLNSVAD